MDLTAVAILALILQKVGSIDTMTSASGTPSSLPSLMGTSGDSDDASSLVSSLDSLGATAAAATWYMSFFNVEALVRLAFIRWRLCAISEDERLGLQVRG